MVERTVYDDVSDVFWAPIYIFWALVPTGFRRELGKIPRRMIVMALGALWTVLSVYWTWRAVSPFLTTPPLIDHYLREAWLFGCHARTVLGDLWARTSFSSFGFVFPTISIIGWTSALFKRKPLTPLEQVSNVTEEVFEYAGSKLAGALGGVSYYIPKALYTPERAIQGSEVVPTKELPPFMVFLVATDGRAIGCGFRVKNAIITAAHNLTGFSEIQLVSNTATCLVKTDDAVVFDHEDLAFFKLSEREFSMLGLSTARLLDSAVTSRYPVHCQIYGPANPVAFTMGVVTPIEGFGRVSYSGTTVRGFSGSPYILNKTVYGMHIGAGMVNLGLDAAYIGMLLSTVNEDTEQWLMDMLEEDMLNKRKIDWTRSPGDPDEIYVKRQGKYFVMDAGSFFSVYEPHSLVKEFTPMTSKLPVYEDSKNDVPAPAHGNVGAGAIGQSSVIRNCVPTQLTSNSFPIPSSIKGLVENSDTDHPEPMRAPQSGPSDCMLKTTSISLEANRRQQKKKNRRPLRSLRGSTNHGSPGLEMIR
nr:hypothetical protein [Luteoviridae sp.]